MVKMEHVALWAEDIEVLRAFYEGYFGARAGAPYVNEKKQFRSYFLSFESGARLELMQRPDVQAAESEGLGGEVTGYAHLAFSVGSEAAVDDLTRRLVDGGYERLSGPRRTGDGYYESVFLDPEGNRVEITV